MEQKGSEIKLIERLKDFFAERQDIMFAWLFGSSATGLTTRFSDIDIAVYVRDHTVLTDMDWYLQLKADLMELVNKEIDLVVLNNARPLIKHTANMQKKVLLSRNALFEAEYSLRVVKEYNDVRYWSRYSRQNLLRGKKNG
ncbi:MULTISPECIES: type VII toxin-antitoxin system MntA family adenylyltransferase antitoxin [Pelosinus]|uniref:DNA polymerase beta domain protein region n=1 Tax=Pelosinus fermentans B4 TaxID=1149862 RepID=I8RP17_9FIRM|nr:MULTISPECIES: nucleotidyltransferase domain-containing protein [Pelosinus]EIW20880.1 DNA polymerase beta domain protein region [Pelosinus fermentans B4]EIW27253.1 DNA polymerase beta domain protein region [Pelosinus fermentans A11]